MIEKVMFNELLEEENYEALEKEIKKLNDISLLGFKKLAIKYLEYIMRLNSQLKEILEDENSSHPFHKEVNEELIHEYNYEKFIYSDCLLECMKLLLLEITINDSIKNQKENIYDSSLANDNPNACSKKAKIEEELSMRIYKNFKSELELLI